MFCRGKNNIKMYDEKELEELCDEFMALEGDMFLESDVDMGKLDNDIVTGNFNLSAAKEPSNLDNNNFLSEADSVLGDKPNVNKQLDLVNQNFVSLNSGEFGRKSKDLRTAGGTGFDKKVDEIDNELKDIDEKLSSPISPLDKNSFHRLGWAPDALGLWHSGPSSLNLSHPSHKNTPSQDLSSSVTYLSHGAQPFSTSSCSAKRTYSHQQLGAKVEMVYSLLSMLDTDNREDMSKTFLAMSSSPESCHAMRQSGCLPLLIQLIYSSELDKEVKNRAAEALHNIVHAQTDEKRRKREVRVLKLLQQLREYCAELKNYSSETHTRIQVSESDKHPINATGTLMKLSFDAEHRQAICTLGGLHAITDLIQVDHEIHGSTNIDTFCVTLRRYAGMALTNLTFEDGKNKALLCSFSKFLLALVDQLKSPSEDLRQVTASVLRNLSWRADVDSKQALRNVSAVTALTISAMEAKKESTLKSILSALWNLSAHCSLNKTDICSVPGALAFIVRMLKYKSSSNTLSIVENAGGILRNISSHIAVREDYRQVLRDNYCFEILLEQLKSPSLTIVSNACGTLWNLSARCSEDQKRLWEMGATSMLRSLVQSKHKMISMGSSAALKNLLSANPNENLLTHLDSTAKSLGLQNLPTLFVRKKRALEQELNITLTETCDNIESVATSFQISKLEDKKEKKHTDSPKRSDSHDSVKSSQSDTVYELLHQKSQVGKDKLLENGTATLHDSLDEKLTNRRSESQRLIKRHTSSMIPTPTSKKTNQDRFNEKAREEKPVADGTNRSLHKTDIKEQTKPDLKQRNKKGIPVLKINQKKAVFRDDISQERSPSTNSHEEDIFDNDETKSLDKENMVNAGNFCHDTEDPISDSHKNLSTSSLNLSKNMENESGSSDQGHRIVRTHEELETHEENGDEPEDEPVLSTRDQVQPTKNNPYAEIEAVYRKTSFQQLNVNFNINSNKMGITEHRSRENEFQSLEHSLNVGMSIENVAEDLNFGTKEPSIVDSSIECIEQNSRKANTLKENLKPSFGKRKEIRSSLRYQDFELSGDQFGSSENSLQDLQLFVKKTAGRGTCEESQVLSEESTNPSTNLDPIGDSCNEINSDTKMQEVPVFPEEEGSFSNDSFECNETEGIIDSYKSTFEEDTSEQPSNVNLDEVGIKASSACIYPRFKVGSPITDSRILQMEARKICREIQKDHDFEMGGSLVSEVSLVSCSSFLDTGDYSLFDCSTDTINFDEPEMFKTLPCAKDHSFPKSVSQAAESACSLPSLGSLKNEQIEALDLDNSVLSVASITSEIDENYTNDHVYLRCCAKTYEVEACNEFREEISGDATVVSKTDDTLNAELLDDDNSLHSQENLPFDNDTFQDETFDRRRTKLTPKEKRKTFQERYKTYTIRDFKTSNNTGKGIIIGDQGKKNVDVMEEAHAAKSCTPDGVGLPYTNSTCNEHKFSRDTEFSFTKENTNGKTQTHDRSLVTLYRERGHEPLQFSKSFDKERDTIPGFVFDSRSLNDLLSIGPSERKELADNAKLVAISLKTAVQDWETEFVSDSEADELHKSLEIDTATYTKTFRNRTQDRLSLQEPQRLQSFKERCTENPERAGAKISKPSNKVDDEVEELSRGIRGKRKPLYSSPQKNLTKGKDCSSSTTSTKIVPAMADTKRSSFQQPAISQPPTLKREGTFTKEDGSVFKKTEGKNFSNLPVLNKNIESKNPTKLNGKNKIIPSSGNSKAAGEGKMSRIGRPLSSYTSKTSDKRAEAEVGQRRPFSAGAGNRTAGEITVAVKKPASACLVSQKLKNSSSSQNVRAGNSSNNSCSIKSRNLNSQSGKSQSDASLNFVDSKEKVEKVKTCKKEVTSKIASLWRKVEETKERNKNLKDTRVWIEPEKNTVSGEDLVMEKEEILHIPTRTIVHSFTCHALTDETFNDFAHPNRSSKNSQDVSHNGSTEERRDRIGKRSIISAVVTPYNYTPPLSATIPSGFKEVDSFQKSSLKITTV